MIGTTTRSRRRMLATAAAGVATALVLVGPVSAATADTAAPEQRVIMTPELQAQIQGMVERFLVDNPSVPGMSLAVVTPEPDGPDPHITTFAAGVADRDSGVPVEASTQFELGSETKVFTADLLASLVAQGTVSLDDPVQKYAPSDVVVPEWVDPVTQEKTSITLLDLATHTAGLTDGAPNLQDGCPKEHDECNPKPGYTPTMLWNSFTKDCADKSLCPLWKPGTAWNYSNWGFALLGDIVAGLITPGAVPAGETGPGRVFQDSLETTFLNELGMTSTTVEFPDTTPATPYNGEHPTNRWNNYDAYVGGGGLISNADDMGAFVAASLGYLPADASAGVKAVADTVAPVVPIRQSCTPISPAPTPTATPSPTPPPSATPSATCTAADFQMGLGWERYPARAEGITVPYAHKNGGTAGSSSDTLLAPSLRIGVTSMFNQNAAGIDQLAPRILSLLIAGPAMPTPTPAPDATLADTGAGAAVPALTATVLLLAGIAVALVRRRAIVRRRPI